MGIELYNWAIKIDGFFLPWSQTLRLENPFKGAPLPWWRHYHSPGSGIIKTRFRGLIHLGATDVSAAAVLSLLKDMRALLLGDDSLTASGAGQGKDGWFYGRQTRVQSGLGLLRTESHSFQWEIFPSTLRAPLPTPAKRSWQQSPMEICQWRRKRRKSWSYTLPYTQSLVVGLS